MLDLLEMRQRRDRAAHYRAYPFMLRVRSIGWYRTAPAPL